MERMETYQTVNKVNFIYYLATRWYILVIAIFLGLFSGAAIRKQMGGTILYNEKNVMDMMNQIEGYEKKVQDYRNKVEIQQENLRTSQDTAQKLLESLQILTDTLQELQAKNDEGEDSDLLPTINSLNTTITQITKAQDTVTNAINSMGSSQTQIENNQKNMDELQNYIDREHAVPSRRSILLGGAVGGAVGCVGAFLALLILYTLTPYWRQEGDIEEIYGFGTLGNVYKPGRWEPAGNLIGKAFGYSVLETERKEEYDIIAAKILIRDAMDSKRLFVTGSIGQDDLKMVCDELNTRLSGEGYEIICGNNPLKDSSSMLRIKDGSVILVEAKNRSKKREIDRLCKFYRDQKKDVVGTIII